MPSDRPPRPGEVAHLAGLLADASGGARRLTPTELAELLWLAAHLPAPPDPDPTPVEAEPHASEPPSPTPRPTPGSEPESKPDSEPEPETKADPKAEPGPDGKGPSRDADAPRPADDRIPLHLPPRPLRRPRPPEPPPGSHGAPPPPPAAPRPPAPGTRRVPLHVPVPPMIAHPLALQRAVRPLKRYVPSPTGRFLDEEATAHRIALLGGRPQGWLPVLAPSPERWLRLCIVHDGGATMPMWRPLVRELHAALAQSGVFRTVELHRAAPDGTVPARAASVPADGRTAVLVVSDCMGPQWREGAAAVRWHRTLRRWAARTPLAVVQPLPEWLWRTTALPTTPGLLSAPHPAAPSATLSFTAFDPLLLPRPEGAVPLPVLEPAANWLANWAALVTDPGGSRVPGSVAWLASAPPLSPRRPTPAPDAGAPPREDITRLTAEELVLRFRSTASPEAFRLAGHLALGEPQLPVMRLVHRAVERNPRPQHLAEVILSGMLAESPEGPPGVYAFRDGVRELLLRSLPRTARGRTRELLAQVGGLIDDRAGVAPGELRAVAHVPDPGGGGAGAGTALGTEGAFATITPESVRQLGGERDHLLGGRYRGVEQIGRSPGVWLADDLSEGGEGEVVVVQRFLSASDRLRASFADEAARLEGFRHAHVAAVRAHGVDGDEGSGGEIPYLVMEFVPGRNLDEVLLGHPEGLPGEELLQVVPPLADAVLALHANGLAHGAISAEQVRLPTERGPVLCGFTLTPYSAAARRTDLLALGRLVHETYTGSVATQVGQASGLPARPGVLPEETLTTLESAVLDLESGRIERQRQGAAKLLDLVSNPTPEVTCSLLGYLRVLRNGRPVPTGTPECQAVLCMLLLNEGRSLSYAELAEGLWGADRADPTLSLLDACLTHIRDVMELPLSEQSDGYSLLLPGPVSSDLFRCRRLADEADAARAAGDAETARDKVQEALAWWRGEQPLDGVPGPAAAQARADINRLQERLLRMDSVEGGEPQHIVAAFECVAPGVRSDVLKEQLGRRLSGLLAHSGLERYTFQPVTRGWQVAVAPEAHPEQLLPALLKGLPALLADLPHLALAVTVAHAPGPTAFSPQLPEELRHLIDREGDALIAVPEALFPSLGLRDLPDAPTFERMPGTDHWYGRITAPPPPATPATPVLLGFEGVFTHLFRGSAARAAALSLLSVVSEYRRPEDALSGVPLLNSDSSVVPSGHLTHPSDVLPALAHHQEYAAELHSHLTTLETERAAAAKPLAQSDALRDLLTGHPVAIVTDTSHQAVSKYLDAHGLPAPRGGIHGRTADLARLMPDADCLTRALRQLAVAPDRCLMLGASPHEAVAARSLGVPFVGHAPDRASAEGLRSVGVSRTVGSVRAFVDIVRAEARGGG
ncbi:SAV_2336 N-terminal domain-related protein [Streptomyces atriruber]|uniref:SAV_2336 N-terminal domain-related protein n=1 Tax=Streptomyces atriruber TaxID=545121 RepID=A0ABV3BKL1_9ACTN